RASGSPPSCSSRSSSAPRRASGSASARLSCSWRSPSARRPHWRRGRTGPSPPPRSSRSASCLRTPISYGEPGGARLELAPAKPRRRRGRSERTDGQAVGWLDGVVAAGSDVVRRVRAEERCEVLHLAPPGAELELAAAVEADSSL